jgi:predicted  nucleic acid-binding Zn-ribbon protein
MDWLKPLEEQIAAVRGTLEELRKENRTLRSKLRRLEQKKGSGDAAEGSGWEKERSEVRRRVASLVHKLEKMVDG